MADTHRVRTPHAAIKIWNYDDRITASGTTASQPNQVSEEIISTLSCSAIQTSKSKSEPIGQFQFVLAPTRNWTAVITPGSWCAIMMSNEPITESSFKKADPKLLKMVGKIETVRTQVTTDDGGMRKTQYLVSGQDWGHVFNNILYIDPLINDPKENQSDQGTALFASLMAAIQKNNTPTPLTVESCIKVLLDLFGRSFSVEGKVTRLGKATHSLIMPPAVVSFLGLQHEQILRNVDLVSGALKTTEGKYSSVADGLTFINAHALAGTNSLWQVLNDYNNNALNEMFNEIMWQNDRPVLTLFNRVKPFAFRNTPVKSSSVGLRSLFKNIPAHQIDDVTVKSINVGTNWRDKYNFIEIKPEAPEFYVYENWTKQKSQAWDKKDVFDREGFRPLIFNVRHLPFTNNTPNPDLLVTWVALLKELYFDTHRLLNGEITLTGSSEYISVGNNIMFDAGLIGVKANYNSEADKAKSCYVLAQVESVTHNFHIDDNGARSFLTTIQFVRGIIVNKDKGLVGEGVLDALSNVLPTSVSKNDTTVVATAHVDNPEPAKGQ